MIATVTSIIAVILILAGVVFFLGTAVGLIRLPDFYTRMHAAGKGDTLSSFLIVLGCAVYAIGHNDAGYVTYLDILLALKLVLICFFIGVGSPTATHAIMDAGYESGIEHWRKGKKAKKK
jgi:multicomponent Na+:H+ antiporter subunit G